MRRRHVPVLGPKRQFKVHVWQWFNPLEMSAMCQHQHQYPGQTDMRRHPGTFRRSQEERREF
eukprot:588271-Prorocentrum_lima.AAC.1